MFNLMFSAKASKKPLYEQLYEFIANEIRAGSINEGERLPSKKALSKHLGISANTVETAYAILADEGYIRSIPRSGHYVCRVEAPAAADEIEYPREETRDREYRIDFRTNAVDVDSFPYATWIKLSKEVMYGHPEYLNGGDVKGDHELRESIARYLHEFRGVKCSPAQVIVGAGLEYLIMLLTELSSENSVFAVENPGYRKSAMIFQNGGRRVNYVGVDESGLRVDELRKTDSTIAYVTPSYQFPTGSVMPVGRRMELLSWAREREGRYIIEDDYNSEFNFSIRPIPAMQGLGGRVIYLSTFSRVIAPSIRIAYMVLPPEILEKFNTRFSLYSSTVPRFEQHTLERFISGGYFSRHLSRVKNIYQKRRARLLEMLKDIGMETSSECVGLHVVVRTKNAKDIIRRAAENGIRLYDMDDYYMDGSGNSDAVIIGYAGASDEDIAELRKILIKH